MLWIHTYQSLVIAVSSGLISPLDTNEVITW